MNTTLLHRSSLAAAGVIASLAIAGHAAPAARADSPCAGAPASNGAVYYVSPAGDDSNAGTSPCAPWQSVTRVNAAHLKPGDTVAFQGGQTFTQTLAPWYGTSGASGEPITYTSFGEGTADLAGGVYLNSESYLTFTNLAITSSTAPGIGTGEAGSGVTNIVVSDSSVSSTNDATIGGYGIGLRNTLDSNWTIASDRIADTADSGVFSVGSHVTIDQDVFVDNGIGDHCGTGAAQNPCHAVYAKGPDDTVTNNTISDPQTAGVSIRFQNEIVENNTITGGQKGIAFNSESTTPGTTIISGNRLSGQTDTGITIAAGSEPLYESFVVSDNTVADPANYDLYVGSGPDSATTQTVTLTGNVFQAGAGAGVDGYVDIAAPASYTGSTYIEHADTFTGATGQTPFYVNGTARTQDFYSTWPAQLAQQPTTGQAPVATTPATPAPPAAVHSSTAPATAPASAPKSAPKSAPASAPKTVAKSAPKSAAKSAPTSARRSTPVARRVVAHPKPRGSSTR